VERIATPEQHVDVFLNGLRGIVLAKASTETNERIQRQLRNILVKLGLFFDQSCLDRQLALHTASELLKRFAYLDSDRS
jgi:hypothetical protein